MIDRSTFNTWLHTATHTPRSLGLPHDELRPVQLEALSILLPILQGRIPFAFSEEPTGTGKSVKPKALAALMPVTVLVHRRALSDQYAREYGFAALHGKDEYPCVHPEKQATWALVSDTAPTAADCRYSPMGECPVAHECPYMIARDRAIFAQATVCTSRMALLNPRINSRPGALVIDEAHTIAEEALGLAQGIIRREEFKRYKLAFPNIPIGRVGLLEEQERTDIIKSVAIASNVLELDSKPDNEGDDIESSRKRKLSTRLERLAVELESGNWFIQCNHEALTLKGLQAERTLSRLWRDDRPTILMSATLGKVDSLARMCGIEDYSFEPYPHPVPKELRPIFDLDLPAMSFDNIQKNADLLAIQAHEICTWIESRPADHRHIALTTSNKKIDILREIVRQRLSARLYIAGGNTLNERVKNFQANLMPGLVSVETLAGWGTGLDWRTGDTTIVAGVQFFDRSDAFSLARVNQMELDMTLDYQDWLAYNGATQAFGRTVRGLKDEQGNYIPKYAVAADGMLTKARAKRQYPKSIKEAIRKV